MHQSNLPFGALSEEIHIACESTVWGEIVNRLRAVSPNEACTFMLTRPSRGEVRTTVILKECIWPLPHEVTATPQSLKLSPTFITRALDAAIDAGEGVGLALIHTHTAAPRGASIAEFSTRDDWYETRLFPTVLGDRRPTVCVSIVIGENNDDVDARIWWRDDTLVKVQPAHIIRIVGPELRFLECKRSHWADHLDPLIMDRSTRIWGAAGRRILQNLRVGVVGLGGTGSISFLSLVTMGVGNLYVWDKDTIGKENRHRLLGIKKTDVGRFKVTELERIAKQVATAEPFKSRAFKDWATSPAGITQMKDCDVVFSCVDKLAARVPLNEFAYAHLIPIVDMSSWIHSNQGVIDAIMTHAHVLSPGLPCCWCSGILSSRALTREAQGKQRGAERRAAYGLSMEETDGVEPSVLPLNLTGVGLALLQFMQVTLRICDRTPHDLRLFLPQWELDESDLNIRAGCDCVPNTALADTLNITPYTF